VALEQADEIPQTIKNKKSLRMPRGRQTPRQGNRVNWCVRQRILDFESVGLNAFLDQIAG